MTRLHLTMTALLMNAVLCMPSVALGEVTDVFVLKLVDGEFAVEAVPLAVNETRVFETSNEIIDVIFPPGPGQSAGLKSPQDGETLVLRNTGEELRLEARSPDGSTRGLPPRALTDLPRYDVRVSVTGGGKRAAFLILQNEIVRSDIGPVANMFAGRLPEAMLDNAYVVQTETYLHEAGAPVAGMVPLEIDRWPFVRVALADGLEADFIVDIGAAGTVVDQSILPDGTEITEASVVEYSAAGKRTLKYSPGGATGQVQTVLGHALLESIALGDVAVGDLGVDVMEKLPDFFGRPVGGILGMDVLRRCPHLTLTLGGGSPRITFGSDEEGGGAGDAIELPFTFVNTHLVVEGQVNGTQVFFVLDSGAPSTYLDQAAALAAGVPVDASRADSARGLDEGVVPVNKGRIESLALGDRLFDGVPCQVSSLSAFDALRGEGQNVGLLGNDFFARFNRIEIDFDGRAVRFVL